MNATKPGWHRLWAHSYRLGLRSLLGGRWRNRHAAKVGLTRLLVPLDPWRYFEMGRIADLNLTGHCLDISSPKLLTSLLQREGRGDWVATDLFTDEIDAWRLIDRGLSLEQCDVRALPYADNTFDNCVSVSVIEHVADDGDNLGMGEMFRVLKPGGSLFLTTEVARHYRETYTDTKHYGNASEATSRGIFFSRSYDLEALRNRLLRQPWEIIQQEFAKQKDRAIEARFYRRAPWSYAYGGALRWLCADNFEISVAMPTLDDDEIAMAFLHLRKPARATD